jgi:hypothetical protein
MATNNGKEIRVAGTGRVLVAPAGNTAPAKSDDVWPTGWVELGYTSVDGIKLNKKDKIDPVDTWQSASPGRFIYSDRDLTVKFQLLQMNKSTLSFFTMASFDVGAARAQRQEALGRAWSFTSTRTPSRSRPS